MNSDKPAVGPDQIIEEFRSILELEKKAAEVYGQLAQDCDHPKVRQWLQRMADEELQHAAIAQRLVRLAENYLKNRDLPEEEKR